MNEVDAKVRRIMGNVLKVNPENIIAQSSHDTIENWDSLAHLNLVLALEQEFKVSFSTDEILEIMSYTKICTTVQDKLSPR